MSTNPLLHQETRSDVCFSEGNFIVDRSLTVLIMMLFRLLLQATLPTSRHTTEKLQFIDLDLGDIPVLAALVLPFSGLEFAVDVYLRSFFYVFRRDLGQTAPQDTSMPFGCLACLSGLFVLPLLAGCHAQRANHVPARDVPDFWILSNIAYQDHRVDASCHLVTPAYATFCFGSRSLWVGVRHPCAGVPS